MFISLLVILFQSLDVFAAEKPALRGGAMLDCSGLPCVEVSVGTGKRLKLLVDTGNVNSVLDTSVAKALALEVAPAQGRDGKPLAGFGRSILRNVNLGDGSLGDVKVLVMNLADDIKRDRMPAADGTLAYTAFKERILELDYPGKKVRFSEPLSEDFHCPRKCGTLTTPTFGKQGPPIVVATGFEVNQKPITAQIDTLFGGTMLIYPTSVEKLGLGEMAARKKQKFFPYTDDGVEMIEGEAKSETFEGRVLSRNAPLYFATESVHLPDGMFDGTVGHALFKDLALTLDLHDMKVWISE